MSIKWQIILSIRTRMMWTWTLVRCICLSHWTRCLSSRIAMHRRAREVDSSCNNSLQAGFVKNSSQVVVIGQANARRAPQTIQHQVIIQVLSYCRPVGRSRPLSLNNRRVTNNAMPRSYQSWRQRKLLGAEKVMAWLRLWMITSHRPIVWTAMDHSTRSTLTWMRLIRGKIRLSLSSLKE